MNQFLMSFLVAGTALGGSALNNVESHTTVQNGKALPAGYFVQKAVDSYAYVSTLTHTQGVCAPTNSNFCAYRVPANNSIPNDQQTYTKEQVEQDLDLSPANPDLGIWIPQPDN